MKKPLVTIITPTWKRPRGLRRAIECVNKQTYENWEHIIVHDGAETDRTELKTPNGQRRKEAFLLWNNDDVGVTPINEGIALAEGELFMVLSDDSEIEPEHIAKLVRLFDEDEDLGFAISLGDAMDATTGKRAFVYSWIVPRYEHHPSNVGQLMVRKDVDAQFGPWNYTRKAYGFDRMDLMMTAGVRHACTEKYTLRAWWHYREAT